MAWDSEWEKLYKNRDWGKYPSEELIRFIANNYYHKADKRNIKILEIGCGIGANIWYCAREGFQVFGVDGSPSAIKKCKARLDVEIPGWNGELLVGDIVSLPYENNKFDAVIDNEAIAHNSFEDSKEIYAEAARVLKIGGRIFSRTFSKGTWGYNTGNLVGHNAWTVAEGPMKGHCKYIRFTEFNEIKELLINFKVENIEKLTRTLENRNHEIEEWLIHGLKH